MYETSTGAGGDGADNKGRFAADLRELRLAARNPTLAALQESTGISRTVLSEAFSGRYVPTARTIDGIVRAFGGDVRAWHDRRDVLAHLAISEKASHAANGKEVDRAQPLRAGAQMRVRTASWIAVAAFVVGTAVSVTVTAVTARPRRPSATRSGLRG
jgi:DNA-binding phage protein